MGICPVNAEQQLVNEKNRGLIEMMAAQLEQLANYGFSQYLLNELGNIRSRYLFTPAILEDLQRMELYSRVTVHKESNASMDLNLEEQLTNSCLILQNEADLLESKDGEGSEDANDSFQTNMRQNQSLVAQISIIYSKDIKREQYLQSLRVFLKWGQIFQQHSYAGFLSPLYQHFCHFICTLPPHDFQAIVDEVCVFVQFMVTVVTEVYALKSLAGSECGKLIKNENVYNMIMSMIFKRTKLKKFLLSAIKINDKNKIELFQRQIERFKNKPPQFFEIGKKFALCKGNGHEEVNTKEGGYSLPYSQSLKLVSELCKSGAPITKLKTIVNISKEIIKDIERYYKPIGREAPQLDPDNLSAIVMYLLVKNGSKSIYEQLKIVEHFTTTNCLNCISGYYLNVFNASIESILTLQQE